MSDYDSFVASKLALNLPTGIANAEPRSEHLFEFQLDLARWALRRGRAAIFCATGLGKTRQQLLWAHYVTRHCSGPVLILAPLAVAGQTAEEGARIGVGVTVCSSASDVRAGINITNYEKLHRFDPGVFEGVAFDESSIVKSYTSKTLAQLMMAFSRTRFKLALTATPSPNDYTELGTHAELLGICSRVEMLSEYFVHDGGETQKWRLKGHARKEFWKFVASWAALVRSPADLGYDASAYELPPLEVQQHIIAADEESVREAGMLFAQPARSLMERRAARRDSVSSRARALVEVIECSNGHVPGAASLSAESPTNESELSNARSAAAEDAAVFSGSGDESATSIPPGSSNERRTASTIGTIPSDTAERANSRTSTIDIGERTTRTTRSSGKRSKSRSSNGPNETPTSTRASAYVGTSGSPSQTMSECSPSKAANAPSAVPNRASTSTSEVDADANFTSITVTPPGKSEASSAPAAISAWESSRTTPVDSNAPQPIYVSRPEKWLVWCNLNREQDEIEKLMRARGISCVSIQGSTPPDERIEMERAWRLDEVQVLITKPTCFGYGLNWQHCARMAFVGVDDSWETYHQAVRRCWRFGQKRAVQVHVFASELEGAVVANLERKERDAAAMAEELSAETAEAVRAEVRGSTSAVRVYSAPNAMTVPFWLKSESEAA